jgi:hypothetical protein
MMNTNARAPWTHMAGWKNSAPPNIIKYLQIIMFKSNPLVNHD